MNRSLLMLAAAFAAVATHAAAPPKPPPEPIIIKIADIHRGHVDVRTSKGEPGAQLTFFFEKKTKRQAHGLFFQGSRKFVRIQDGQQLIAECRAVGISTLGSEKERPKYGLVLGFDSVEEANRVAQAIRPFLK